MDKILFIGDDPVIRRDLKLLFESVGYVLEAAQDGVSGLAALRAAPPNLVLLDLKLPVIAGRDVLRAIAESALRLPVIILSASSDEVDKVLMLELGADDYVTKPFSARELLARVSAVMRRARSRREPAQFTFDTVFVDFLQMKLTRAGQPVPLSSQEFKILKYFVRNPERVVSRSELLDEVWGRHCSVSTRLADYYVWALRRKLEEDPSKALHFRTVHGVGYKFVP